jgi:hypothetical protein
MFAPRPAAGPPLAFLQLLLGPANAAFSGRLLLGILDPADELVSRQGCDVLPGSECRGVGGQGLAQVRRQFVHHPTGHSLAAHEASVTPMCETVFRQCVCGQCIHAHLCERVTKVRATWEDARYPRNWRRRGILDVEEHMQTATSYADAAFCADLAHAWAHEPQAAQ